MILSELWQQSLIAIAGGIAAELLHWYMVFRQNKPVKAYAKKTLYWLTSFGMILLSGLMPILYISGSANALLCFHLGIATPLLLMKLASGMPANIQPQGRNRNDISFHDFISW